MADPLNPRRMSKLWDPKRIDAQLVELDAIKHLTILSGGWLQGVEWMRCLQWIDVVPKKLSTVDLETEFVDGRFLVTHNSPQAALMKSPPQFDVEVHPAAISADALLEAHLIRLRRRLAAEPEVKPCVIRTLDDALASQKGQEGIKHAHRKSVGWVTKEEMQRLAMPGAKGVARDVHDEIRKLDDPGGRS